MLKVELTRVLKINKCVYRFAQLSMVQCFDILLFLLSLKRGSIQRRPLGAHYIALSSCRFYRQLFSVTFYAQYFEKTLSNYWYLRSNFRTNVEFARSTRLHYKFVVIQKFVFFVYWIEISRFHHVQGGSKYHCTPQPGREFTNNYWFVLF